MSLAINNALFARWTGEEDLSAYPTAAAAQARLVELLATVTSGEHTKKAVHFGNFSRVVRYPCITFRPGGGTEALRGGGLPPIDSVIYDVEIWDNSEDEAVIAEIDDCLGILTDRRRRDARNWRTAAAPPLPLESGNCFYMHRLMNLTLRYDSTRNAWFGLTRFRIIEAQY